MSGNSGRANTNWFRDCKWGTMSHYLAGAASAVSTPALSIDEWNRQVDSVDVERLAEQIVASGAKYHIFTIGQNSGFYCAPNVAYDAKVGKPSKLSERDLFGDLAAALTSRNIHAFAYLPSHGPASDIHALEALRFTPRWDMSGVGIMPGSYRREPDADDRLTDALRNWEEVIAEWSLRWRTKVSGWWFDGCNYADVLYRHADEPNFQSIIRAAKRGNPNALVSFNLGAKMPVISATELEDFTAGELNDLWIGNKWNEPQRYIGAAQLHVLTYLGSWWGEGPLRMDIEMAAAYTKHINHREGVVTWDIPVTKDGQIPQPFIENLVRMRNMV